MSIHDLITIDGIARLKTVLDETERIPGRDGSGDFRTTVASIMDSRCIKQNVTFDIGTGGDYADFNSALDDLMRYRIGNGVTVTLQLITGFSPVNVEQRHPQGGQIILDLNGQNYRVASGSAFTADYGRVLRLINSGADATISTSDNGVGAGIFAQRGGIVSVDISALSDIIVGANGYGFLNGVFALGGRILANRVQTQYNTRGVYSLQGGFASLSNGQANNNTTGLNAARGSYIDAITTALSSNTANASPTVNTVGNNNSYVCHTAP